MSTYHDILEELCRETNTTQEASNSQESLHTILERHQANGVVLVLLDDEDITDGGVVPTLPFRPGGLTDCLVNRLFSVPSASNSNETTAATAVVTNGDYLVVAKALVECLPSIYLSAIAKSVSDKLRASNDLPTLHELEEATPGLLRLWVSLITQNARVDVHEWLTDALMGLLQRDVNRDSAAAGTIMAYWVEDWTAHLRNSNSTDAKVAAFRCAAALVPWVCLVGPAEAQAHGATKLFLELIGDFGDPLQQLGLLDALTEHLEQNPSRVPPATSEWLSSADFLSLLEKFLEDPLLSGAGLRYAGALCATSAPSAGLLDRILDHVRGAVQDRVPTRDTDRLPLVRAVAGVAPFALSQILGDPRLRGAWVRTQGIAGPKLKAAILVSVATVLPAIVTKCGPHRALELYRALGEDHHAPTTTQWLLALAVAPIPEVKVAAMALLEAGLRIPGAAMGLVGIADRDAHAKLLKVLLHPSRESTTHARQARYELLSAFYKAIQACPALEEDPKRLKQLSDQLALGPHGQKARNHGSDEPATQ